MNEEDIAISIAVLYHKPSVILKNDIYMPLQVAKPETGINLNMDSDDLSLIHI